jgi:hypothetical protein
MIRLYIKKKIKTGFTRKNLKNIQPLRSDITAEINSQIFTPCNITKHLYTKTSQNKLIHMNPIEVGIDNRGNITKHCKLEWLCDIFLFERYYCCKKSDYFLRYIIHSNGEIMDTNIEQSQGHLWEDILCADTLANISM